MDKGRRAARFITSATQRRAPSGPNVSRVSKATRSPSGDRRGANTDGGNSPSTVLAPSTLTIASSYPRVAWRPSRTAVTSVRAPIRVARHAACPAAQSSRSRQHSNEMLNLQPRGAFRTACQRLSLGRLDLYRRSQSIRQNRHLPVLMSSSCIPPVLQKHLNRRRNRAKKLIINGDELVRTRSRRGRQTPQLKATSSPPSAPAELRLTLQPLCKPSSVCSPVNPLATSCRRAPDCFRIVCLVFVLRVPYFQVHTGSKTDAEARALACAAESSPPSLRHTWR